MTTSKVWEGLFPPQPFAFRFAARPGDARQFFADSAAHDSRMRLRRSILASHPERHAFETALAHEAIGELAAWAQLPGASCHALGQHWEQDFMLLLPDPDGQPVFVAGAVCFPSSWTPREKLGLPLQAIHAPVPTLNERLGDRIATFLAQIPPEQAWERVNWGLSAFPQLNQHPALDLPRLQPPFSLTEIWLRREDQVLFRLPRSGALIFGINVETIAVAAIAADPIGCAGLLNALQTMPAEIATYKGLSNGRGHLLNLLAGSAEVAEQRPGPKGVLST